MAIFALRQQLDTAAKVFARHCEGETDRALEVQRKLNERRAKLAAMVGGEGGGARGGARVGGRRGNRGGPTVRRGGAV